MPYIKFNKVPGGPYSLKFRPLDTTGKSSKEYMHVIVGQELWIDDEYIDYFLNYTHRCEDNATRNLFTEPDGGTTGDMQQKNEVQSSALRDALNKIQAQTGVDLSEELSRIPAINDATTIKNIVRCATCDQKVRVAMTDTDCPHCHGFVRDSGVISTNKLDSKQKTCPVDGCDFVTNPKADPDRSLRIHTSRVHGD